MSITKFQPFSEINQLIEDLPMFSFKNLGWDLAVDLYEENDSIVVKINVPGVDPDNVSVLIDDNHLRISGSTEEEKETEGKYYYSKEIRRGSFEKVIPLPQAVKKDNVSAEYEKGVLKIVLEKDEKKETPLKIEVKTKK